MEQKDPAALFYIDKWLVSTAEMDADCRGWYLNLILHQYNQTSIPSDIEKLAVLANVKHSEFERFKQVFEQVLKHKFEQNSEGRLENPFAKQIIQNNPEQKGCSHWNWNGGITSENLKIRTSDEYKNWRKSIFIRDNFICTNCKIKGTTLHAHHIKKFSQFPDLRFDINNGITLCKKCHKTIHTNTNVNTNKNTVGMEKGNIPFDRPSISNVSSELNDELNNHLKEIELNQKQEYESSKSK